MPTGTLYINLHLPGCASLKEKRSRVKPILSRLRKEFNISVCEYDLQDVWKDTVLAAAAVSSDGVQVRQVLARVAEYIERSWPDEQIVNQHIEMD